jgi:poly(hydroxyalkanoate) depolymerase family esterase
MDWKRVARAFGRRKLSSGRRGGKWVTGIASSASGSRKYRLWVPITHDSQKPSPLIMMLHGCGQSAKQLATICGMNAIAERNNFLVVYPEQTTRANPLGCWNWFDQKNQTRDAGEPSILAAVIEAAVSSHNVDPDRVYVAGLSAGAAMAVVLGATYPDLFTAIGVVAGIEFAAGTSAVSGLGAMRRGGPDPDHQGFLAFQAMGPGLRVKPKRRMPVIVFQGTADRYLNPVNAEQIITQWARTNDYLDGNGDGGSVLDRAGELTNGSVPGGHSFQKREYEDSAGRLLMEKWLIQGMGHAWPGSPSAGRFEDPKGPNASEEMWRFFCDTTLDSLDSRQTNLSRVVNLFNQAVQYIKPSTIRLSSSSKASLTVPNVKSPPPALDEH